MITVKPGDMLENIIEMSITYDNDSILDVEPGNLFCVIDVDEKGNFDLYDIQKQRYANDFDIGFLNGADWSDDIYFVKL